MATVHSDFRAQENKIWHYFHFFPISLPWSGGTECHDLSFFECWVSNQLFHSPLSPSLGVFTLSSSSSLIRVVSSTYLKLLVFLLAVLILLCDLPSPAFHIMYSAYRLNKQGDNIQSCHIPFPILNQSIVPCLLILERHMGFSGDR